MARARAWAWAWAMGAGGVAVALLNLAENATLPHAPARVDFAALGLPGYAAAADGGEAETRRVTCLWSGKVLFAAAEGGFGYIRTARLRPARAGRIIKLATILYYITKVIYAINYLFMYNNIYVIRYAKRNIAVHDIRYLFTILASA